MLGRSIFGLFTHLLDELCRLLLSGVDLVRVLSAGLLVNHVADLVDTFLRLVMMLTDKVLDLVDNGHIFPRSLCSSSGPIRSRPIAWIHTHFSGESHRFAGRLSFLTWADGR